MAKKDRNLVTLSVVFKKIDTKTISEIWYQNVTDAKRSLILYYTYKKRCSDGICLQKFTENKMIK